MVVNLVPQDSHQPGPRRGFPAKTALGFDRRQKRFLYEVLGGVQIAHLADGKVEKIISVGFHPIASESGLTVSGRCHIGFVCHSDKPYCNGRATKLPMNVNC